MFGDNRYVVTSSTIPHSALSRRHNVLAYHRVREAIAAKIIVYTWLKSNYNLSDVLSKHWDHVSIYPALLKLFITRGKIELIPSEATVPEDKKMEDKKNKDEEMKDKENKDEKTETKTSEEKKDKVTTTTRGELQNSS